jgi:RHS repeat-associated protein
VIAIYDALGNPAEMSYDVENNTEIVGDREGNESILGYDDRGNITSVTDPMGATTTYTFDANNNQLSVTNGRGFTTNQTYDERGNSTSVTDANNQTWQFTYNLHNDVTSIIDPLGRIQTFIYDGNGKLSEYVDSNNQTILYVVDGLGRLTQYTDRNAETTVLAYGTGSQPTRITNPGGSYREIEYNLLGQQVLLRDEEGRETAFTYDGAGQPTTVLDAEDGLVTVVYDNQQVERVVDQMGRVTRYEYDENGRRIKTIDPLGGIASYAYNANGEVVSVTDSLGHTTAYTYRADGHLDTVRDAFGGITRYQYDAARNRTGVIDAHGHGTTFEYDMLNRLAKETNHLGGVGLYTYDAVGNLTSERDENGHLTQFVYDALNRRIERIDALSNSAEWTYDDEGYVLTYTDETNHTTTFAYNSRHWLTSITNPAGKVQSFGFDDVGNRTSFTDELYRTTAYAYDGLNRLTHVTEPLIAVTTYDYDAVGNRISVVDPLLRETTYEYDDLNRLIKETDPRDAETSYTYDAAGNLKSLTDPVGNATTFGYDSLHRLVEERDALGGARTFEYDSVGNLTRRIDRNGRLIEYSFDALDRLTKEQWGTADPNDTEFALTFTYDAASNLVTATDPNSTYTYTYDALDRVLTDSNAGTPGAPSITLTSGYDDAGRRTNVGDNAGVTVGSNYNSRGLLERRTWSGGGIDPARLDFTYNDASQRSEIKRYSDTSGTNQIGRTTFGYDAQGRKNDIVHRDALDAVLADYDYVFDLADQLTSSTHHGQATTYTHDDAGQLTAANHSIQADESYSYNFNGNRTTTGIVTGPSNQVLSDGFFNYEYDGEGNLLTKTEIATGTITAYEYDFRNRLVAVRQYDNTGEDLLHEVKFTYDVFNRRIAKSVDADGEGASAAVVTRFVYDGDHVWTDYSSTGVVLARYLFGDRTDEILARYQPTGGTAWYLTDNLGTVRDLVDEAGSLLNHIDYDSFGGIIVQSNVAAGDRFTYTGRELDAEIGLYYYRARFYDPVLGRFIANDPSGFDAGDANLYRYVENSPLTWVDPTGRFGVSYAMLSRAGTVAASGVAGYVLGWVCGYLEAAYSDDPSVQANKFEIAERAANFGFIIGAATGLVAPVFPAISAATGLVGAAGYLFANGNNTQRGIRVGCIAASFLTGGVIGRLGPKVPRAPIDLYFGGVIRQFLVGKVGAVGPQGNQALGALIRAVARMAGSGAEKARLLTEGAPATGATFDPVPGIPGVQAVFKGAPRAVDGKSPLLVVLKNGRLLRGTDDALVPDPSGKTDGLRIMITRLKDVQ